MAENNDKPRSKTPADFDFMDAEVMARYVTDTGKILPRRITGLPAKYQRAVTKAIKRSRAMLLMK